MKVAKRGGKVASDARKSYEKETKMSAISKQNSLNYQYKDDNKLIENKQITIQLLQIMQQLKKQ